MSTIEVTTAIRVCCALLSLATVIHFGFICNFLNQKATLKIKVSAAISVATGAMLLGCTINNEKPEELMLHLVSMSVAFMIYEVSKWVDGLHLCRFYAKRRTSKV